MLNAPGWQGWQRPISDSLRDTRRTMSEASAEIIRRANDAFRRGDWDAVSASIDPHVRVRTDPTWPEQRIYGQEAWIAFLGGRGNRGDATSALRRSSISGIGCSRSPTSA